MTDAGMELFAAEPSDWSEWDYESIDRIELSDEQVEQSRQFAQAQQTRRWEMYLQMLARLAVQQWLNDRVPDLPFQDRFVPERRTESRSAFSDQGLPYPLEVNAFKLQVITAGTFLDATVNLPAASLELPDRRSHFFVLVEVIEEQQQARIRGACNALQIMQQQVSPLQPDADGTYALPRAWFSLDANTLLLQLRCLEPAAMPLASVMPDAGVPDPIADSIADSIASPVSLPQQAINAAVWLSNQLDDLAQRLDWLLLPTSLSLTPAFRNQEQLEQIRQALEAIDVTIPPGAKGASRELGWEGGSLRLYVLVWELPSSEWSMLVVVGAGTDTRLSTGVQLRIRDRSQTLIEQTSGNSLTHICLYGQVIGEWGEQFWVSVTTDDGAVFDIPPFTFNLESES